MVNNKSKLGNLYISFYFDFAVFSPKSSASLTFVYHMAFYLSGYPEELGRKFLHQPISLKICLRQYLLFQLFL